MAMKKMSTTFELNDGAVHGPIRVIFADKIQWEKSSRANGWPESEFTLQSFLTWHAAKRTGITTMGYEEFLDSLIDIQIENKEDEESDGDPI